jgi:predicted NUDIX family NTP pyrophosphohydrolase
MAQQNISAGLLMYRLRAELEVLIAHPGGPLFAKKDLGAWSIPKGLIDPGDDPLATAKREFEEETGLVIPPDTAFADLGQVTLKSRKVVYGFAFEGDCDPTQCTSNDFEMEWPRGSGRICRFPEVDRVAFFTAGGAKRKLNPAQAPFVDRLQHWLVSRQAL